MNNKKTREKLQIKKEIGSIDFDGGIVEDLENKLSYYKNNDIIENYGYENTSFVVFRDREETDEEYNERLNKNKKVKEVLKKDAVFKIKMQCQKYNIDKEDLFGE